MSKTNTETTLVFDISKTYQKEISQWPRFFVSQKHIELSTLKLHQFSIEIASKNTLKQRRFFTHWSYIKKSTYVKISRRNFSIFSFRHIGIISTSNGSRFDVVCLLGWLWRMKVQIKESVKTIDCFPTNTKTS